MIPGFAGGAGAFLARKALEIAAAGGHHLSFIGVPGSGKTMLARCLPGILPPLNDEEALEVTSIHSLAGTFMPANGLMRCPPFIAPHHSATLPALIGEVAGLLPRRYFLSSPGRAFPR